MASDADILNALFLAAGGLPEPAEARARPLGAEARGPDNASRAPSGEARISPRTEPQTGPQTGPETGTPPSPGWTRFLSLLAEATGADTVALRLDQQGQPVHLWSHGAAPLDLGDRRRMRVNRVYAQGDQPGLVRRNAPLRAIRYATVPGEADLSATLQLQKAGRDFRAIDGVRLSDLSPHMGPALTLWQAGLRTRRAQALDRGLTRALGASWVLFSAGATVVDIAPGLAAPLEEIGGLRIAADGRMSFRDAATGAALRQALVGLSRPQVSQPASPVLLRLSDRPGMEILLSPLPGDPDRLILGQLRQTPRAARLDPARVATHFGLKPSEARLALRLCDGRSLQEAAADLGWTIETARSASKQVFARMEVRGQTGLLHRMLTSALWLEAAQDGTADLTDAAPDGHQNSL